MANGSQVSTGAKLILSIGSREIAYANNVTFTKNHNVQAIEVCGRESVLEHAELGMTVEFSCSMFRVNKKAAVELGLMPKLNHFLDQPTLVATIKDKVQDAVMMTLTGLKCISRNGSYDARGVWTETLNFVGILAYDETGPEDNFPGTPIV